MWTKLLLISMIFLSCNTEINSHKSIAGPDDTEQDLRDTSVLAKMDTLKGISQIKCDTTIKYDLENLSSEGSEAEACYFKKHLQKVNITMYGASGRVEVFYDFVNGIIKATERTYRYLKPLSEIKSEKDIKLESTVKYTLSNTGRIVEGKSADAEEIYKSFIKVVPLKI